MAYGGKSGSARVSKQEICNHHFFEDVSSISTHHKWTAEILYQTRHFELLSQKVSIYNYFCRFLF